MWGLFVEVSAFSSSLSVCSHEAVAFNTPKVGAEIRLAPGGTSLFFHAGLQHFGNDKQTRQDRAGQGTQQAGRGGRKHGF